MDFHFSEFFKKKTGKFETTQYFQYEAMSFHMSQHHILVAFENKSGSQPHFVTFRKRRFNIDRSMSDEPKTQMSFAA